MSEHIVHQEGRRIGSSAVVDPEAGEPRLARQLSNRHIQLIAIGGAIGTGLFMGSGKTVSLAGPSVIFVYTIIGFFLFFVMRAMGELLLSNLHYKSFTDAAVDLIGPWAGFVTGWTYWFCWIVAGMADVVAIAGYVAYWKPDIPLWIPALVAVALLVGLNLPTVKAFGEAEFWFALIKILAIVALIIVGLVMVLTKFTTSGGSTAAFANLWSHGGLFPTGLTGFVAGFQIATFAFVGIELVGATAAEARDPLKTLPRAINAVPVRVGLFYVVTLTVILAVTPWTEMKPGQSPFVSVFALAGLGIAASVVNLVVLTAATSSANSGIYSTSRMVYGLSCQGDAPRWFNRLSSRKVPANALYLSGVFLLAGVVLVAAGDSIIAAFTFVTTISALCFIFVWSIIVIAYMAYRKKFPERHAASTYKMPGGVPMCWAVLGFFAFVIWAFTQKADTLHALQCTPVWFVVLAIVWSVVRKRPHHLQKETVFEAELESDEPMASA